MAILHHSTYITGIAEFDTNDHLHAIDFSAMNH